jgi:uncharacterized protein (TIGR03083 family)
VADLSAVLVDLAAEGNDLDALVAALPAAEWSRATPAEGWTIAHQIGHLAWTDDVATLAAVDADQFQVRLQETLADIDGFVDRAAMVSALASVPPGTKLPWFGPPMSATSMATARLMETWAHGQDIADALGVVRLPTPRLHHVAHIGVRTRNFAFLVRDRAVPGEQFRVELAAPGGEVWTWGPDDADQRVTGPALDFCLLVTQRRHRDDLALQAEGPDADTWLDIAQAFAGPPGVGRSPSGAAI